jgi:hypothetical protein
MAPLIYRVTDIPELILLGLVPGALAVVSLPGVIYACRGGKDRDLLVSRSILALLISLLCPIVVGFGILTVHPAGFAVAAYGVSLIIGVAIAVVAALLLRASYERNAQP